MSGAAHVTRRRPCVCCVTEIAADCVMTSVAVPCDRTRYPAAFGSREHLLYIGHNLAVHAVSWGFVFVWTTFFGLLRDHKSVDEFIVWGIGATLFTASGIITAHSMRHDDMTKEVSKGVIGFYASAAFCTLCAGATGRVVDDVLSACGLATCLPLLATATRGGRDARVCACPSSATAFAW